MKNDFNVLVAAGLMLVAVTAAKALQENHSTVKTTEPTKLEAVIPEKTKVKRNLVVTKLY